MPTIALDFRPAHKKAEEFHRDTSKFRLICGAWRAAKSWTLMDETREMAMRIASRSGAGGLIGIFRKYGPGLDDTTWGMDFRARVPDELIVKGSDKKEKGRPECTLLGGTRIVGRAMDDWKKFGGWPFDAIFISQAEEFTEQDFNMLRGRLSGKQGPRRMSLDANPPPRSHWLYKHFGDPATRQEGYSCHHFSMLDNAHNLPEDYVAEHLKLRETNPALYKRFVLGEWGYTHEGSPVYPEFRETRHVHRLQPIRGEDMFMLWGWDFGYHYPACVWGQLLPSGHLLVLREKMAIDTNIRLFARAAIQEHYTHFPGFKIAPLENPRNRVRVWVDPAGKQKNDLGTTSIKEIVKEGLFPRYRKLKIVRSIYQMQTLMREDHMGVPLYRIDPQCRILIEGNGGGYHMDPDTDLPVKDGFYDHLQDGERHMAVPAMMGGAMPTKTGPPPQRPRVAI